MVYLVWLVIMGLIVGFLAFPLAQRIGYSYGRFGRTGDLVAIVVGTVIGGLVITALGGVIGSFISGDAGAVIGGILGAIITILLLGVAATKAAVDEPNTPDQTN